MKLYLGIRQINSCLYLATLDNQGVAVFKSCCPSVFHYTDILLDDPFYFSDPYRYALLQAILDSLSE